MDKKQKVRVSGYKKAKLGVELNIFDRNDHNICTGDYVHIVSCDYSGVVLYNHETDSYGIMFGKWYGEDEFDENSYGKFIELKKDNGMKADIELIKAFSN